ncbi:MAG: GUN4 domain-containing protein, partial [Leptolyngbyaceae bacterium]|nr:GUN4 domain-containing protein [Leptolyngbyaceae bacterium]
DKSVAQFGLELLIEYYPEHPETLPFLLNSVERSSVILPSTEGWIMHLLVRHYRDDPSVLPFLKQIAQTHSSYDLRTSALCNLARGYGRHPEILSFLQHCIQAEQNRDRPVWMWDVMNTIGNTCADNPQTLSWLKELAQDTGNGQLRNSAIAVLSDHFLSDPETYQLLSDVAQNESDEKLRFTAFRAIAKHTAKTEGDQSEEWEPIPIEVPDIPDDCGDDYIRLRDLLKAQQWRAAEAETWSLIQQKLGREAGSIIRLEEILSMSSEDLQTIDRLWTSTSWGHFGFSIQRAIYLQCGGTLDGQYPGDDVWQRFCQRVGWIVSGFLGSYGDIQFHLRAPAGHLPLWATVSEFGDCHYQHLFADQAPDIDYTKLSNFLENNQWKEADYETYLIMLQAGGRYDPGEGIPKEDLRQFPCAVLQTIDHLWITASKGKFGFSLQKNIYLQSGGVLNGQVPSTDVWQEFNRRVGWSVEGRGIWYDDLTFSLDAPIGHLPTPCWHTYNTRSLTIIGMIGSGLYDCLFPRIEACT